MKTQVGRWQTGDTVRGRVTEQLSSGDLIISFEGDLLRVSNETNQQFKPGDFVLLTVASLDPIQFRLAKSQRPARTPGKFDVTV